MNTIENYQWTDLTYLSEICDGDRELMKTMLDMIVAEIPAEIEKMQDAAQQRDWKELFELAHKMKTTLAYVGNADMIATTKTLEMFARNLTALHEIPELMRSLAQAASKTMVELKRRAQNIG